VYFIYIYGFDCYTYCYYCKEGQKNLTFWQALWRSFVGVFGVLFLIGLLIIFFEQLGVEHIQTPTITFTPTITSKPTSTKRPTATMITKPTAEQCTPARSITINQKGQSIEVCGKITFTRTENCLECPSGFYSYLVLDNSFYILSYDWVFNSGWIGDCIMVKDKVEQFDGKPAFVFGKRDGYDGSNCEILPNGIKSFTGGDYFMSYSGCR